MAHNSEEVMMALRRAKHSIPNSLENLGVAVERDLVKATSRPGPPSAPPFSPPRRRSGRLSGSFDHKVRGTTISWFNRAPHFGFVQQGTRKMQPRPVFPWEVVKNLVQYIKRYIGGGITRAERG